MAQWKCQGSCWSFRSQHRWTSLQRSCLGHWALTTFLAYAGYQLLPYLIMFFTLLLHPKFTSKMFLPNSLFAFILGMRADGPSAVRASKAEEPHSCACGSLLKGCWQQPEARPAAEVIPTSVCSLLFCSLLFLPHGLAKAERQKITGMQYNPANQRETPCLSFSTLCLYLVFPFSEELVPNISCFPRINQLAGCCGKKICIQSGPWRPSQARPMFLSPSPGSNLF